MLNVIAEADFDEHLLWFPLEELRTLLIRMLTKVSMFEFDAKVAAQRMLDADLRGIPQHGAIGILESLQAIDLGDIDPRGRVVTVVDKPAFAVLDGSRAIGAVAATKGLELAISKARECGTGTVAIGNSQSLGSAAVYAALAAEQNMIGFCCTSSGGATVIAPGTVEAAVGNHGFAWAIPTGLSADSTPLVIDFSTGAASWAEIRLLQSLGLPIPPGIALNAQGEAVSSAAAAARLLPAGGAFGFGMALACGILAGPLSGGRLPLHKKKANPSANDSEHFCYVLDVGQFADVERFYREVSTAITEIRALSTTADGPVRIPGDCCALEQRRSSDPGVPLLRSTAVAIRERALKMKLDSSLFQSVE